MQGVKILLVDDNRLFLKSIEKYLQSINRRIIIAGKAFSGAGAIQASLKLMPDLILMDIAMPGMGGLEATRAIKAEHNPPRIIILTMHESEEYHKAAEAAGADGFVSKFRLYDTLAPCINLLFPPSHIDNRHTGDDLLTPAHKSSTHR